MRFSNPRSAESEYGRLSGSAHTRSSRALAFAARSSASAAPATARMRPSRQREDIQHAALLGLLLQIGHHVGPARRCRLVARIDVVCDDRAGPSADAGKNRNVLLAVGAAIGDGLA